MQFTTKRALILFLGILVSFSMLGCKTTVTTTTPTFTGATPSLSNPDDIFFSGNTYNITYGDIYEEFKINDGINRLLFMVDSILLADYISAVTQSEITEKVKYLKYGTTDDTEIANFTEQELLDLEDAYNQNMSLLGYANNADEYVKMVIAKEKYAREAMTNSDNSDETWYVGPSTIATYFASTFFEDASSIKIRFYSETDAKNVLRHFNLVSLNGTLKLYTGTKPLDQVPSSSLNDTNTVALTQDELIDAFIDMYNYVYGEYRDSISKDLTLTELVSLDQLKVNYADTYANNATLATYLFKTLGSATETNNGTSTKAYYTYQPVKYYGTNDTSYYMILNLEKSVKNDVSDFSGDEQDLIAIIGSGTYDTIKQTLIDTSLETSGFVANRIATLRSDNNFLIYDYYLGIDYQAIDASYVANEEGDESIVASFGNHNITADEFFATAMNINGALYTLYASQMAVVMDKYYEQVYCSDTSVACDYTFASNTSARMEEHRTSLADLKTSFLDSYYTLYYTFDEYIYLAYGAQSEDDMLAKYYVKSNLQPYLVYDEITKDNWALLTDYLYNLVQDYYDNYFCLNVEHLLIYLDRDEDGTQDNYTDFVAGLADPAAYEIVLTNFEAAITTYLADSTHTFASLITDYLKASRSDATWGEFKNYGFYLMTEDLSSSESLTYLNSVDTYEQSFVDALIQTYQQYILPENVDSDSYYYDQFVETSYGMHMIYATKGTDFTKPSAKFTMTYDELGDPNYDLNVVNTSDVPSIEQLKLFSEYRFDQIAYGTADDAEATYGFTLPSIPTSVLNAMEAYFTTLHDSMYIVGFLNIIVSDKLIEGNFVNTHSSYCSVSEADLKARLAEIHDIYFDQVFSSLDTTK